MVQMSSPADSVWLQLKNQEITCEKALALLVNPQGQVNLRLLDSEVSNRFFQSFPNRQELPPVMPLLLWQNCYYLGSSAALLPQQVQMLGDRTGTRIKILKISPKSYQLWLQTQPRSGNSPEANGTAPSLPDDFTPADMGLLAGLSLAKATDQGDRIRTIISGALRHRASDIHLEPTPEGLRIRYRIDGILRDVTLLPPDVSRRVIVALKVMSQMDIAESRRPQDGRIGDRYVFGEDEAVEVDMRVSTLPCIGGEKMVIRLLPQENPFSSMDTLGFSPSALAVYQNWLRQPQGMIILTGPTGSGKTSTLYTSLQAVASEHINVVTVEDPVEYVLPRITQTQVHEAAGMTFAAGLRAILRQDPDLIMVGEIRDAETAETAIRAALTGHLVLTTLHTNDAISAIPRLRDLGPDPGLVGDALLGIVAQRLVRRVCPHCAEPYTPTATDLNILGVEPAKAADQTWRRGRGCGKCFNSGYLGREAIIELIDVNHRVRSLIHEGTVNQLHQYLSETRYESFRVAALSKVAAGLTTVQEIMRVLPYSAWAHQGLSTAAQESAAAD